jgi:hypothetical protein
MNNHKMSLILAALVFFGATALVIVFYRLEIEDSASIIALILVPLLYGIASGSILELSDPGGWSAKFREVVQERVIAIPVFRQGQLL